MFRKTISWAALMLIAVLIVGCDGNVPSQDTSQLTGPEIKDNSPTVNDPTRTVQETMQVITYQATKDAMNLAPESHIVPKNDHPAQTALEILVNNAASPEHISVIPVGTKVISMNVKNHIAYADFNEKLVKNNSGGSTEEVLLVSAIVNTLTEFPEIQKVQILVNGKKVDTINGHMDTGEPLSRADKIIKR